MILILLPISRFSTLFTRPLETDRKTLLSIVADLKSDMGDLDSSSDIPVLHSLYQAYGDRSETLLSIVVNLKSYLGDLDLSSSLLFITYFFTVLETSRKTLPRIAANLYHSLI